jgi:hypothetical protein
MVVFLTVTLWFLLAFTAADYTLARLTLKDPLRAILAAIFAVTYVAVVVRPF